MRHLAAVGKADEMHNQAEPLACIDCGRESCVRHFDGKRWFPRCAMCVLAVRERAGAQSRAAWRKAYR